MLIERDWTHEPDDETDRVRLGVAGVTKDVEGAVGPVGTEDSLFERDLPVADAIWEATVEPASVKPVVPTPPANQSVSRCVLSTQILSVIISPNFRKSCPASCSDASLGGEGTRRSCSEQPKHARAGALRLDRHSSRSTPNLPPWRP